MSSWLSSHGGASVVCSPAAATGTSSADGLSVLLLSVRADGAVIPLVSGARSTTWSVDACVFVAPGRSPFRPHRGPEGSAESARAAHPETFERAAGVVDEFQSIAGRVREFLQGVVPRPPPANDCSRERCRTTVGLVVKGTFVEGLVVGSPAFFCRQLRKGDQILQIDGKQATQQSIAASLDSHRPPGSAVSIEYLSKEPEKRVRTVTLCAISMQEVGERCSAIQLMEKLKEETAQLTDTCLPDLVGHVNTNLVKFLAEEASLQVEIWDNFCRWQSRLASDLDDLETCMAQLYAFNVAALAAHSPTTEVADQASTSASEQRQKDREHVETSLKLTIDALTAEMMELKALLAASQKEVSDLESINTKQHRELETMHTQCRNLQQELSAVLRLKETPTSAHLTEVVADVQAKKPHSIHFSKRLTKKNSDQHGELFANLGYQKKTRTREFGTLLHALCYCDGLTGM